MIKPYSGETLGTVTPLDQLDLSTNFKYILTLVWGAKVEDYIQNYPSNEESPWRWKSVDNLGLLPKEQEKLETILRECPIIYHDKEDKLIWTTSKDGTYKVKEG